MINFLGIGAQKAGTTWLYEQLRQHPDLIFPAVKELHFWDIHYPHHDINWYQAQFPQTHSTQRAGEITPAYAILPTERIHTIYQNFPDLALIYLIRNPLERAWSSALMALKRAEMQIFEASDIWFIDHFHSQGSLRRGDYQTCITHWRKVFPASQLFIARFERIQNQPFELLQEICKHIGVTGDFYATIPTSQLQEKVFAGSGEPLRPSLRKVLQTLYQPQIARLSDYLNEDFSDWLK